MVWVDMDGELVDQVVEQEHWERLEHFSEHWEHVPECWEQVQVQALGRCQKRQ